MSDASNQGQIEPLSTDFEVSEVFAVCIIDSSIAGLSAKSISDFELMAPVPETRTGEMDRLANEPSAPCSV